MRFNKIGQTILLALSLTAIIVAMSCSGADATKPEDMKIDLGQELGSGRHITPALATAPNADNTGKFVLVTGATNHFLSSLMNEPSMSNYRSGNGAGIMVTDILKVLRADSNANATPENQDITGVATAVKNDAGGVYRVDLATLDVTNVKIEFSYKLKTITTSTTAPKITHTKIGINNDTTNWSYINLTNEIEGSSEGSLLGKTYVFGTSTNINNTPTRYSNGMITNIILTNLSIPANSGVYKLWIY